MSFAGVTRAYDLDTVLAEMEKTENNIQTISLQFTQTAVILITEEKQRIQGKAYFQRPDKFRVEHKLPQSQVIVSNGQMLWFFNPTKNQVLIDSWKNWTQSAGFPKGLTPFHLDVKNMREKYSIALETEKEQSLENSVVLRMTPHDSGPWPYTFFVWVDTKTWLPQKTEMLSKSVQSVTEIQDVDINPDLPTDLFLFAAPEGVDVYDSRAAEDIP